MVYIFQNFRKKNKSIFLLFKNKFSKKQIPVFEGKLSFKLIIVSFEVLEISKSVNVPWHRKRPEISNTCTSTELRSGTLSKFEKFVSNQIIK